MNDESAAQAMAAAIAAAAQIAENACTPVSIFGGSETCTVASPRMMIDEPNLMKRKRDPNSVLVSQVCNDTPETDNDIHHSSHESVQFMSKSKNCVTKHHPSHCDMDQLGHQPSNGNDDDVEDEDDDDNEEDDAEKRIARSRERNREHARRTRLRKKAQLETLKLEAQGLEAENKKLKQSIEECNIASILLGISSGHIVQSADHHNNDVGVPMPRVSDDLLGKHSMRSISEDDEEKTSEPIKLTLDGQTHLVGGSKTHINWKSGVYCDENGARKTLSKRQLEALRRERNRMHAKMTRDRRKSFVATILKKIDELADDNKRMRQVLARVAKNHHFGPNAVITPHASPQLAGAGAPSNDDIKTPDIQESMSYPAIVNSY